MTFQHYKIMWDNPPKHHGKVVSELKDVFPQLRLEFHGRLTDAKFYGGFSSLKGAKIAWFLAVNKNCWTIHDHSQNQTEALYIIASLIMDWLRHCKHLTEMWLTFAETER